MSLPRYVQVDSPDHISHIEVLEAFVNNQTRREFNVRLRRGLAPLDGPLVAALRNAFSIPETWTADVLPLAGDRTVRFLSPAQQEAKEVFSKPTIGRTVNQFTLSGKKAKPE